LGKRGKILGWYRGPTPVIYATDPEFLKEVFIKDSENFIDRPMIDRSDNIPHLIMLKGEKKLASHRISHKSPSCKILVLKDEILNLNFLTLTLLISSLFQMKSKIVKLIIIAYLPEWGS
jgi:hypothetical protein